MKKDYISQYVPGFYEKQNGKTNTITLTQELLNAVVNDIFSYKFNDWTDKELLLEKEFKANEIITSGFKIRDVEFLKAFFLFKGTNSDLQYILNNIGYDSVVYNDGGIYHQTDKDSPIIQVPVQEHKGGLSGCEIEIQIQINLNDPNLAGEYGGLDTGPIKKIIDERINLCSFLNKISVLIKVDEYIDIGNITDDIVFKRELSPMEDSIFYEYYLDPIEYGRDNNDNLKYGGRANKSSPYYGQDKIKFFGPIKDEVDFTIKRNFIFEDTISAKSLKDHLIVDERLEDRINYKNITDDYMTSKSYCESDSYRIKEIYDLITYNPETFESELPLDEKGIVYYPDGEHYKSNPIIRRYGKEAVLKYIKDEFQDKTKSSPKPNDRIDIESLKETINITTNPKRETMSDTIGAAITDSSETIVSNTNKDQIADVSESITYTSDKQQIEKVPDMTDEIEITVTSGEPKDVTFKITNKTVRLVLPYQSSNFGGSSKTFTDFAVATTQEQYDNIMDNLQPGETGEISLSVTDSNGRTYMLSGIPVVIMNSQESFAESSSISDEEVSQLKRYGADVEYYNRIATEGVPSGISLIKVSESTPNSIGFRLEKIYNNPYFVTMSFIKYSVVKS